MRPRECQYTHCQCFRPSKHRRTKSNQVHNEPAMTRRDEGIYSKLERSSVELFRSFVILFRFLFRRFSSNKSRSTKFRVLFYPAMHSLNSDQVVMLKMRITKCELPRS